MVGGCKNPPYLGGLVLTAPTSPYITSDLLAGLQQNLLKGLPDFTVNTAIIKENTDLYISWISSQVDMKFSEAGFVLPLAAISGEDWPTHQTLFLQLLVALGTSSLMSSSLKPAPAVGPGTTASQVNDYEKRFQDALNRIYDGKRHLLRFRADFYIGTAAEKALNEPRRPMSDWMEGYIDQTKYMNLYDYTELREVIDAGIIDSVDKWDYMYDFLNIGYGY
jgi:hypothetical protein